MWNLSTQNVHSISSTFIVNKTVFKGDLLCNSKGRKHIFYEGILTLGDAVKVRDIDEQEVWMSKSDLCFVNSYAREPIN